MISVKTDLHTHTIFSMHAYSTMWENVANAKAMGMEALGITDHYSRLFYPEMQHNWFGHFGNYGACPRDWDGLKMLFGAEVDIVGLDGTLFGEEVPLWYDIDGRVANINDLYFNRLDYLIASVHSKEFAENASRMETTKMYCAVCENKRVMIIGHPGRSRLPFDLDEVLTCAKENNTLIEINDASFTNDWGVSKECIDIATRCAELEVPIAVNSDAHCCYYVGRFTGAMKMLEEIHFPEHLIANRTYDSLKPYLKAAKPKE